MSKNGVKNNVKHNLGSIVYCVQSTSNTSTFALLWRREDSQSVRIQDDSQGRGGLECEATSLECG